MSALSRRDALKLCGGLASAAALCGLAGCTNSSEDSDSQMGYADDTEIKDYELTIYIMADSNLQRHNASTNGLGRLEAFFSQYQEQPGRGDVSIGVKYMTTAEIAAAIEDGFDETFDGLVACTSSVDAGVENGLLYGGKGGTSERTFSAVLNEKLVFVKAADSSAEMPQAATLDGEDAEDGSITKLQSLPQFDGTIGLASTDTMEGVMANKMLYRNGFYTADDGVSGSYADGLKDKLAVYDDIDKLLAALLAGECNLAVIAASSTWENSSVTTVYEPDFTTSAYSGASLTDAEEGGVVRDFFEYLVRLV